MHYHIDIYRHNRFQFRTENDASLSNLVATYDILELQFPQKEGFDLIIVRTEIVKTTLDIHAMRNLLALRNSIRQNGL